MDATVVGALTTTHFRLSVISGFLWLSICVRIHIVNTSASANAQYTGPPSVTFGLPLCCSLFIEEIELPSIACFVTCLEAINK